MFNPVYFHYHLKRGGVSATILNSILALSEAGLIKSALTIAAGDLSGSEWFFNSLRSRIEPEIRIVKIEHPSLGFWGQGISDLEQCTEDLKTLLNELAAPETVFWPQNPSIGLNPCIMKAFRDFALQNPGQKIWLHVHDNAEQGRWANIKLMREKLGKGYYFISPGTKWLVINKTDRTNFISSGMPAANIKYLPNAVRKRDFSKKEYPGKDLKKDISSYAKSKGFKYNPESPVLLFMGRTIRRKNLLELAALAALPEKPATLFLTLPSDMDKDMEYQKKVHRVFRKHARGIGGFGPELIGTRYSMLELTEISSALGMSSVMEGFGLPFIESVFYRRPLIAKKLGVCEEFSRIIPGLPHGYYDNLMIPVDMSLKKRMTEQYRIKIEKTSAALGIPAPIASSCMERIKDIFSEEFVPFSYLSSDAQLDLFGPMLQNKEKVLGANPFINEYISEEFFNKYHDWPLIEDKIRKELGLGKYAENVKSLLESPDGLESRDFDAPAFGKNLAESFFTPESLRLLLD
ncbi:MAG: hypothetical protein ACLFQK_04165 [Fibrobacterota bacterium]